MTKSGLTNEAIKKMPRDADDYPLPSLAEFSKFLIYKYDEATEQMDDDRENELKLVEGWIGAFYRAIELDFEKTNRNHGREKRGQALAARLEASKPATDDTFTPQQ